MGRLALARPAISTPHPKERDTPVTEILYDTDADLSLIQSKKVAIVGYG